MPFRELQIGKENARFLDSESANFRDGSSCDADGTGFGAQTGSPAIRASGITAEAAEEDADMQLVLLALQPGEETLDAFVFVFGIALENQTALFGRELTPRHVRGDSTATRPFFGFLEQCAVAWFRPWFDGPVVEGLAGIGDDEIQIEIDGISETLAARARSVRIVKGEKAGLRLLVKRAVILAFEALVEDEAFGGISGGVRHEFEDGLALPFAVTDFDGVDETRARFRTDGEAIH